MAVIKVTTRIHALVLLFLMIPTLLITMFTCGAIINYSTLALTPDLKDLNEWATFLGGFLGGMYVYQKFIVIHFLTLVSFLHLTLDFRVRVTWKEAKMVASLFVPNSEGTWYPLTEAKKVPRAQRKDFIIEFARQAGRLNWH